MPRLKPPETADVAIVGSGYTGLNAADTVENAGNRAGAAVEWSGARSAAISRGKESRDFIFFMVGQVSFVD